MVIILDRVADQQNKFNSSIPKTKPHIQTHSHLLHSVVHHHKTKWMDNKQDIHTQEMQTNKRVYAQNLYS